MSNIIMGFPNLADKCTLSGGSWLASLPLTNLQDRRISKKTRSTNTATASTQFQITLDKERIVNLFAVVGHNLSTSAQFRIRGNTSASFSTPLYDSGWKDVWVDMADGIYGGLEWESDSFWTWKMDPEEAAYYPGLAFEFIENIVTYRYWLIEFSDLTNSDGYVEIGRLFVGNSFLPENNASFSWSLGYEDGSMIEEAIGGAEYYDQRPKYRVCRFGLDWLGETEAMTTALGASRILGVTDEVLLIWDKDDGNNLMRQSFLGRLRSLTPIENPDPVRFTTAYEIKEIIA